MKDAFGNRMKRYEAVSNPLLPINSYVFIRVDGKAFHTFTKGMNKPFDQDLDFSMGIAMARTAKEMQGFKLAYHQSDEVTFCLTDTDSHQSEPWFGNELNKLVSITASIFTANFNDAADVPLFFKHDKKKVMAYFDARAFVVPAIDAPNVFVWRQKDWFRNSLMMHAQSLYSHSELHGKTRPELHEMIWHKGENWALLEDWKRNGTWWDGEHFANDEKTYEDIAEKIGIKL